MLIYVPPPLCPLPPIARPGFVFHRVIVGDDRGSAIVRSSHVVRRSHNNYPWGRLLPKRPCPGVSAPYTHSMNEPDFHHPPPAYSEQEFNQKTSHALEISSRADPPEPSQQELWEEWDDAAFEAAARARQALDNQSSSRESTAHSQSFGGGSSTHLFLDNTQPLRIQKHKKPGRKSEPKPPPTWLAEAEYGTPSSGRTGSGIQHHEVHPKDDDEPQAIPPPPFAPPNDGLVRMTYEPQSPIPSPLTSPTFPPASLPSDSAPSGRPQQHNTRPGNHLYSSRPSRQKLPSPPHPSPNYPIPPPPGLVPIQNLRNNNTRPESGAPASLFYQQRSQTVGQPQVQAYDPGAFYK